jgi:hypothetical protein
MNAYRAKSGAISAVPEIAYNIFNSKFQEPSKNEGISEVIKIQPTFEFSSQEELKKFLQRT